MNQLYLIMGVSGAGKTTIGKGLAKQLAIPFFDADDFHPPENIAKMSSGQPLNDEDRYPWLLRLNQLLQDQQEQGAVLACSALKDRYRQILEQDISGGIQFIFLKVSKELLLQRMQQRNHFMPPALLDSQLTTLEEPRDALIVDAGASAALVLENIFHQLAINP